MNKIRRRGIETFSLSIMISLLVFITAFYLIQSKKSLYDYVTIKELKIEHKNLKAPIDIVPISSNEVDAVIYSNSISLKTLPTHIKKRKFIEMILPSILVAKYRLSDLKAKVVELRAEPKLSSEEENLLEELFSTYKTKDLDILLNRLETHPNSIVLAQAAVESGWGSSRFFTEANNIFGIWSFNKKDKRIAANGMRGDKTIYLKKYDDLEESIRDYFQTVGRSSSFKNFRSNRLISKDPLRLIEDLKYYSELREEYVQKLRNVIIHNDLERYDAYVLSDNSFKSYKKRLQ